MPQVQRAVAHTVGDLDLVAVTAPGYGVTTSGTNIRTMVWY